MAQGRAIDHQQIFINAIDEATGRIKLAGGVVRFNALTFPVLIMQAFDWNDEAVAKGAINMSDEFLTEVVLLEANATDEEREIFGPLVPIAIRGFLAREAAEHKRKATLFAEAARKNRDRRRVYHKHKSGHAAGDTP
jgi:hypothetical protein